MLYLRVKNWERFQHYQKRTPPWIKLHRDLLRDYNFSCLQDASKLHLVLIWLLASQLDNKIPADENFIKNQIGVKGDINFKELINNGFLIDDSGLLARCNQDAILETETETETETKRKKEQGAKKSEIEILPNWILEQNWIDFLEMRKKIKKPPTEKAKQLVIKKLEILKQSGNDPNKVLEESIKNCWQDVYELKKENNNANKTGFDNNFRGGAGGTNVPTGSNRDRLMSAIFNAGTSDE